MSRPVRYIIPATFLSIGIVFTGCKTIYSDTYSPRRNHFVAVKEKPKSLPVEPLLDAVPPPSDDLQSMGLPPVAPPSAPVAPTDAVPMPDGGAAPMIPGL